MNKFNIPKREFSDGPKKMVSMRVPVKLWDSLNLLAEKKGWQITDLVTTTLDQLLQQENMSARKILRPKK